MNITPEEYINKVICGDAIEEMKKLPDDCVDSVITDPLSEYPIFNQIRQSFRYRQWVSDVFTGDNFTC